MTKKFSLRILQNRLTLVTVVAIAVYAAASIYFHPIHRQDALFVTLLLTSVVATGGELWDRFHGWRHNR